MNASACSVSLRTTDGAALPTLVTAMPEPRSISELPSTSTITPPPAAVTNTGSIVPTPSATCCLLPGQLLDRQWAGDLGDQVTFLGESGTAGACRS